MDKKPSRIRVDVALPVARVTLDRPDVRNAFDDETILELTAAFDSLGRNSEIRAVVLAGEGSVFCSGADINWMRKAGGYTRDENIADASRMARMLRTIDTCSHPVVCRIQGAAIGGGVGLAAACDVVIASSETVFSLAEVRLGILPAAISPYVLRAIGVRQARDLFLSGDRFGADEAKRIGLVHHVTSRNELDGAVEKKVASLSASGPEAVAAAKRLIEVVSGMGIEEALPATADAIADRRASAEGREGLAAFLEKRKPAWTR